MKRLLIIALSILSWSFASAQATHSVMSCNIRITGLPADEVDGRRWDDRKDICLKVIKSRKPDIICMQEVIYDFSNAMFDLGVRYEYNFWPYGTGRDYRGAKRLTPFVFGGVGGVLVSTNDKSVISLSVPVGVGVKYKVARRLNLSLEWAMHFTDSDRLDGVADPYHIKSTGLFKNRDCYSMLQLSLTYSFLPKCVTCNNDIDD